MNLLKSVKLPTNKKRHSLPYRVVTTATILFLIISILAINNYYRSKLTEKEFGIKAANVKLREKEEELHLAITNRGKFLKTFNTTYDFADYGIYSPIFDNKSVENTVYLYKGNTITKKVIILDKVGATNGPVTSSVAWEFDAQDEYKNTNNLNYAIFDGYENYSLRPTYLEDIKASWKDSYTNKNGTEMHWSYDFVFNSSEIYAINLEFIQNFTPNGNPVLVKLSKTNLQAKSLSDSTSLAAKKSLMDLADTISYKK